MTPDFIDRTIRVSWVIGAVLFVFLAPSVPMSVTWGVSIGLFLSGLNLRILQRLFGSLFQGSSKAKMLSYLGMKFPLFYGLLFLVLYLFPLSLGAFFLGFVLPFIVIVLKAVGQVSLERSSSIMHTER
ncbi:hypothetical protein [Candidatus Manganitrophus noduliformans]|uniref:ATP synthase I chain n=1 Tax=Candidatus Manganitrophus noduliformans TaxID=2606439 RepID=A0A7X6ICK0_9BACT|nr:hypothetical protein [Candidatus Manganitrophus noduliformans]NKE72758.1 hypothetical protein [Candidatus Manganitrophus noduliformans]